MRLAGRMRHSIQINGMRSTTAANSTTAMTASARGLPFNGAVILRPIATTRPAAPAATAPIIDCTAGRSPKAL